MRKTTGSVKKVKVKVKTKGKGPARYKRKWQVRMTFTDQATGKRTDVKRLFDKESDARQHLWKLLLHHRKTGAVEKMTEQMTFAEAAKHYTELKLIPAVYSGERKIAGLLELSAPKAFLKVLVEHFGRRKLRNIRHSDLEKFKLLRLKTPIVRDVWERRTAKEANLAKEAKPTGGRKQKVEKIKKRIERPRSIRAVNAELQLMNAILNFAERSGWIEKNPFKQGESLIRKADETARERTMSFEEEARLLVFCVNERAHLRPLIITAVDGGLRRGELFKLEWTDVSFAERMIHLPAIKTKTGKARDVAMTTRIYEELQKWRESTLPGQALVFGITNNIKRAWATACRLAAIEDLHLHDLRHTFVTRAIAAGVPVAEAMKTSGHTTLTMLNRYLNPDTESVKRVAAALDAMQQQASLESSRLVN